MSHEDAIALVAVSLEALVHRRQLPHEEALPYMPIGLLRIALDQLDKEGANTLDIRAEFRMEGFDISEFNSLSAAGESIDAEEIQSKTELSGSKVPKVVAAAILTKFQEGWSKSRIAREFRLNRRTIIKICAGR